MGIEKYTKNELFRASFILLVLTNIANILNYLFHFLMGRMLGPTDYGVLAVLTSIIYIFSVPTSSIQTVVSKNTTKFSISKDYGKINAMIKSMVKEASLISIILLFLYLILSLIFYKIIGIPLLLLILTGFYLFGALLSPIGTGILQGMKKFSILGWTAIFNSMIKLIIAIVLVLIGFKVYGPIIGFIIGTITSFLFVLLFIKEVFNGEGSSKKTRIVSIGNISTLLAVLAITLMYSLDIIFAKAFFNAETAGLYSVVSMIGKMVFFATTSISNVMFPISSEKFMNKYNPFPMIKKAFFITFVLCLSAVVICLFFPKLIIYILFGSQYTSAYGILKYCVLSFSFLSFLNAFVLYKISIEELKIRHALLLLSFVFLQFILVFLFKTSLASFSIAFMCANLIVLLLSFILIRRRK